MNHITLQGIPNCDSVKKAKQWLAQHHIKYDFRDYKKQPPTLEELSIWSQQVGWANLLNKRGTTWRKLTPEQQDIDPDQALQLMAAQPSLIKRPLLFCNGKALLGFKADTYKTFFAL